MGDWIEGRLISDEGKGGCCNDTAHVVTASSDKSQSSSSRRNAVCATLQDHPISISKASTMAIIDIYYYEADIFWCTIPIIA